MPVYISNTKGYLFCSTKIKRVNNLPYLNSQSTCNQAIPMGCNEAKMLLNRFTWLFKPMLLSTLFGFYPIN